jgi:OmcA/MtrC family decaheme c-type cytochrome
VYGFGSSVNDFKEVRFPGKLNQCETCHLPGTYQLPIAAGALGMSVNTVTYSDTALGKSSPWDDQNVGPTGAACSGCHDTPAALAHTQVDTYFYSTFLHGSENDSCAVCHGPGAAYDVKNVHGIK